MVVALTLSVNAGTIDSAGNISLRTITTIMQVDQTVQARAPGQVETLVSFNSDYEAEHNIVVLTNTPAVAPKLINEDQYTAFLARAPGHEGFDAVTYRIEAEPSASLSGIMAQDITLFADDISRDGECPNAHQTNTRVSAVNSIDYGSGGYTGSSLSVYIAIEEGAMDEIQIDATGGAAVLKTIVLQTALVVTC
ncbi:hypothetical protein KKA15_05190 [Patescibacteria group bacterium]|nr:hypothetical protein [Patescibacteria group bacterium]